MSLVEFKFPRLQSVQHESLAVQLAAIEYSISSPIIIKDASDIQSRKHWSEHLEPYEHQVRNLITFCRRAPVALIADDVGLGKTISAGLIISELMARNRLQRTLVLAPKLLLPQWADELKSKFKIKAEHASGRELDGVLRRSPPVVITTYQTALAQMERLQETGFGMVVLDEAHALRNLYGTSRAPRIAVRIQSALRDGVFNYVLMLTATPIQNRLWDIYSMVDLLVTARNHANPLGSKAQFVSTYLADGAATARVLRPSQRDRFRQHLQDYMVRTSRRDVKLAFPARTVQTILCSKGNVEAEMEELVVSSMPRLNRLEQVSLAKALMSSPAAIAAQLKNRAQRLPTVATAANRAEALAEQAPLGNKMKHLEAIVNTLKSERGPSWRMVVFTERKATQRAIGEALLRLGAKVGYIGGDFSRTANLHISQYRTEPPEVNALVSTEAGAQGANLQAGNVVVNYDLPWNPMTVEQRIGRVQRLGSEFAEVVVFNLVVEDSVEEHVVARLMEKLQVISAALGDVEGILSAFADLKDGDIEDTEDFENTIEELVLRSLSGQDTTEALQEQEKNIERAKALYRDSRHIVDENLGALDAMHAAGPSIPDLTRRDPSLDVEDFVTLAYRALGADVEEVSGQLLVRLGGQAPSRIAFERDDPDLRQDAGPFGGHRTVYYAPGERPFEQLVGQWKVKRQHSVQRHDGGAYETAESVVRDWLATLGSDLVLHNTSIVSQKQLFDGVFHVRVSASVAHDRYEKLIEVAVIDAPPASSARSVTSADQDIFDGSSIPTEMLLPHVKQQLESAVESDSDVSAFCDFYRQRMSEELSRAGPDDARAASVRERFEPVLRAEVVGAGGAVSALVEARIHYSYDESPAYELTLNLKTADRRLVQPPPIGTCSVSGRRAPMPDLEPCAISNQPVLKHLLVESELSHRRAAPQHIRTCAVTGQKVLEYEVRLTESGREVSLPELGNCAVSGALAASDELERCSFTNAVVLGRYIGKSEVSGRPYRLDEEGQSALSGRRGHITEYSRCAATGDLIASDEMGISWQSGLQVRADLLSPSEKDESHLGLQGEFVKCTISGKKMLPKEMVSSSVSGALADADLMPKCAKSGQYALPHELISCDETKDRILPNESAVCTETGKRVRSDLLETLVGTDRLVLRRLLTTCPETDIRGLDRDFVTCEETGSRVHPSALVECSVSHRMVVRRLTVQCPGCGLNLLREYAVASSSGSRGHREHLFASDLTGRTFFAAYPARCVATGVLLEPDLISGDNLALAIANSIAKRQANEPADGSVSGAVAYVLRSIGLDPLRVWSVSVPATSCVGALVEWKSYATGTIMQGVCLIDLEASALVGEFADFQFERGESPVAETSDFHWRFRLQERVECEETGDRVLASEAAKCVITRKHVRSDLVEASGLSGKVALRRLFRVCPETGVRGLDSEFESCEVTGLRVAPSALVRCSVSRKQVIKRLTVACPSCGEFLLEEHSVTADDGARGHREHLQVSEITGRNYFKGFMQRCRVTGVLVEPEYLSEFGVMLAIMQVVSAGVETATHNPSQMEPIRTALLAIDEKPRRHWISPISDSSVVGVFVDRSGLLGLNRRHGVCLVDLDKARLIGTFADANPERARKQMADGITIGSGWIAVPRAT